MAKPIIPLIIRGHLYFQTADVLFETFPHGATAPEAHKLGIVEVVS